MLIREKWVQVFVMDNNDGACDNLNRYAREMYHDIQRRVNIKPGLCPIPPVRFKWCFVLKSYFLFQTNLLELFENCLLDL